jgi:acetyltransferase
LGKVLKRPLIFDASGNIPGYDREGIAGILEGKGGVLSPEAVTRVLEKAGFTFPPQTIAASVDETKKACDAVGYPVVIKVIGPLHKSDVGGVKLGINNAAEARQAWHDLMAIPDAEGVTVQKMVEGTEVILGSSRAGDIGQLVMFGLGGIYTEVLKDVSFALAPLSDEECLRMIRSIRAYRILEGVRGQKGVSLDVISTNMARLSRLVSDFPAIREIDINPLKGMGDELYVVDARIILET